MDQAGGFRGWLAAARAGKKAGQHTFIRLHSAPVTQLLIVTSVPEKGCPLPQGDRATLLGIMNKQDYARWHSYQFYLSTGTVDPSIRPPGALDVRAPETRRSVDLIGPHVLL